MKDKVLIDWIYFTESLKLKFKRRFFKKSDDVKEVISNLQNEDYKYGISYAEYDMHKIEHSPIPRHMYAISVHPNPKFQAAVNKESSMYENNVFKSFDFPVDTDKI